MMIKRILPQKLFDIKQTLAPEKKGNMGRGSYSHFAQYANSQGQKQFPLCANYKMFLMSIGIPDFYAVGSHLAEK